MRIAVFAATEGELRPLREEVFSSSRLADHEIDIEVTGVGMVSTAYVLGQKLATQSYDLLLHLGIAGAYDQKLKLGEVVEIGVDTFCEMGAESPQELLTLRKLDLPQFRIGQQNFYDTFQNPATPLPDVQRVAGLTVNRVHGRAASIAEIRARFPAARVESMEGAAFLYALQRSGTRGYALRAISNYVEPRNRAAWNIPLALRNLHRIALNTLIASLNT